MRRMVWQLWSACWLSMQPCRWETGDGCRMLPACNEDPSPNSVGLPNGIALIELPEGTTDHALNCCIQERCMAESKQRRELHNQLMDLKGAIRVFCRLAGPPWLCDGVECMCAMHLDLPCFCIPARQCWSSRLPSRMLNL